MSNKSLSTLKCQQKNVEQVVRKRRNNKITLIQYKGGKCEKCGYNKPIPTAYHFHHTDPKNKSFTIGPNLCRKLDILKQEADKCILLCANCHASIHDEEFVKSHEETILRIKARTIDDLKIISFQRQRPATIKKCQFCQQEFKHKYNKVFCSLTCSHAFKRKVQNRPSKEVLLQMTKEEGFSAVGRKFGVSDNTIRKWIKQP